MTTNSNTTVERIVAKFDNDFNPDNSDWIPRMGAWIIDALSQLKLLNTIRKERTLVVVDRIIYPECPIEVNNLKMFTMGGAPINKVGEFKVVNNSSSSTGHLKVTPKTVTAQSNPNDPYKPDAVIAMTRVDKDVRQRDFVVEIDCNCPSEGYNYMPISNNKFELNFETDCVRVISDEADTVYSEQYDCDLPVVPNNGELIEAIVQYCMYKMLSRGYKHPVFNLGASQYGTNPYYNWTQSKSTVKRSVLLDKQGRVIEDKNLWNNAFYINTFNPRNK